MIWLLETRNDLMCLVFPATNIFIAGAHPCLAEEQEAPSNALASVVQFVPLELMDGVIRNLTNDDSITDVQMMTAISR